MIISIGTSNRSLGEFLDELVRRQVTQVIDVRSSPFSRLPWFNAPQIERWAEQAGIMYRQEGQILGGRSAVPMTDCAYRTAVKRLIRAATREHVAFFCAEGEPEQCHRSWVVGASLLVHHGVHVTNIRRDGTEEEILVTLAKVPAHLFDNSLRREILPLLAVKATQNNRRKGE